MNEEHVAPFFKESLPTAASLTSAESLARRREAAIARGVSTAHPVFVERASGRRVWDTDGRRYYDFVGGIGVAQRRARPSRESSPRSRSKPRALHAHVLPSDDVRAVRRVAERTQRARARAPRRKKRCSLSTGAEATENAVKIAREYTRPPGGHRVHARLPRPHAARALDDRARTRRTSSTSGRSAARSITRRFRYEHHGWTTQRALRRARRALRSAASRPTASPRSSSSRCSAKAGSSRYPREFLRELRRITRASTASCSIADEIQTGFGRTGTLLRVRALRHRARPDHRCEIARPAACRWRRSSARPRSWTRPTPGGLGGTFAGNPVACAAALATFEIMDEAFFDASARDRRARPRRRCTRCSARFPQRRRRARARRDDRRWNSAQPAPRTQRSWRRRANAACC